MDIWTKGLSKRVSFFLVGPLIYNISLINTLELEYGATVLLLGHVKNTRLLFDYKPRNTCTYIHEKRKKKKPCKNNRMHIFSLVCGFVYVLILISRTRFF